MLWLAFGCICLACMIIGFVIGKLVPIAGFSEGTAYKSWLMNRKLGDHVYSLKHDQISYVQFDLEDYTITFQKMRIYRSDQQPDTDYADTDHDFEPLGNEDEEAS